jgi:transmembrane sensor
LNNTIKTEPDDSDAVREAKAQARAWMVHLRSGEATPTDIQAFRRWCTAHPEHAQGVTALSDVWGTVGAAMQEVAQRKPQTAGAWRAGVAPTHPLRPGRRAWLGFAVVAGASWLALRPPLGLWPALGDLAADYRTGTGEQRKVALNDRVVVEMNTQTRIDVLHAQAVRSGISLLAGETEVVATRPVDMAADPAGNRPFLVVAGRGRLQALDARFDVRRDGNEVCVTCVSGSVTFDHPQQRLTLLAAQQLIYDDSVVRSVSRVDPSTVTAWRRGILVFESMPLAQVVEEINRYRPGKLILRNAALGASRVEAQLPIGKLDDAIDLLGKSYGAHVTRLPGDIVLLS